MASREPPSTASSQSQTALGRYYLESIGGDARPNAAIHWLRKAAKAGDPDAQALLGKTFRWGWGRKRIAANPEFAEKWLRAAAAQGRPKDQYNLAKLYYDEELYERARIPLDKAVAQDLPEAWVLLARMHREGLGVPVNPAESVRLLRVSTGFGDPASRNDLGEALARGIGVKKDVEAAFALFEAAAMQGYVEAQYNLALAYLDGIGVERDKLRGHAWLRICTSQTFREAIKERGRRRGDLSVEERREVKSARAGARIPVAALRERQTATGFDSDRGVRHQSRARSRGALPASLPSARCGGSGG